MINTVWAFPSCSHKNSVFPCRILNLFSVTASRYSRIKGESTKLASGLCFSPKCILWLYSSPFRCLGLQNPFPALQFLLSTAKTLPQLPFLFFNTFSSPLLNFHYFNFVILSSTLLLYARARESSAHVPRLTGRVLFQVSGSKGESGGSCV